MRILLPLFTAGCLADIAYGQDNPCSYCSTFNEDIRVTIVPEETPDQNLFLERVSSITPGTSTLEETGEEVHICILQLEPVELEIDEVIPVDQTGYGMILLDDGLTFLPLSEIIAMINERTCEFMSPAMM